MKTNRVADAEVSLAPGRKVSSSRGCTFASWHLRRKLEVMGRLFEQYLTPGAKFMDMACGEGEALVMASRISAGSCELWGLDIDQPSLAVAARRVPEAILVEGDIRCPPFSVPRLYFDVVHEYGAAYLVRDWTALAGSYLSLLRPGGVLLWELPQRWSTAHISHLFSVAPKITASDTRFRRLLRSFLPSKYTFESDSVVSLALQKVGDVTELGKVTIWHFYCRGLLRAVLNGVSHFTGEVLFERLDDLAARLWPRSAGYYLVLRKQGSGQRRTLLSAEHAARVTER